MKPKKISEQEKADILRFWRIDIERGVITWKVNRNKCKAGTVVGSSTYAGGNRRYIEAKLMGRRYLLHRVVYFFATGTQPDEVDHIDGDGLNNRIINLRAANRTTNARNQKKHKRNISGVTGVCFESAREKWRSTIVADGALIFLGRFDNFDDAVAARRAAEKKYQFSPTHGRSAEYRRENANRVRSEFCSGYCATRPAD